MNSKWVSMARTTPESRSIGFCSRRAAAMRRRNSSVDGDSFFHRISPPEQDRTVGEPTWQASLGGLAVDGQDVPGPAGLEVQGDVLAAAPLDVQAVLAGVAAEILKEDLVDGRPRRDIDLRELDPVGPVHDRPLEQLERREVQGLQTVAVDSDLELSHGPPGGPILSVFEAA